MTEVAAQILGLIDAGIATTPGLETNQAIAKAVESGQLQAAPDLTVENMFGGEAPKQVSYREWWTRERMEEEIQKRTPQTVDIKAKDGTDVPFTRRTQQVAGMPKDGGGEIGGFVTVAYEPLQGGFGAKMKVKTATGVTGADGKPLYNETEIDMNKIDEVFMLDEESPDIEGRVQKLIAAVQDGVLRVGRPIGTVPVRKGTYSISKSTCISDEV